jgi:hypothetical protein
VLIYFDNKRTAQTRPPGAQLKNNDGRVAGTLVLAWQESRSRGPDKHVYNKSGAPQAAFCPLPLSSWRRGSLSPFSLAISSSAVAAATV